MEGAKHEVKLAEDISISGHAVHDRAGLRLVCGVQKGAQSG